MKSKLIVIDGLDGSGKTTQFELLKTRLNENSVSFKPISFPEYDKTSSALVKMYLNGELSKSADGVNAYAASSFYAADRYISYKLYWEDNYRKGDVIIASRYVSSNAIHQTAKLANNKWDEYLEWLDDYEFSRLELPRPDETILLDMPAEISSMLISSRYHGDESKRDIHEDNLNYLKGCRNAALYAARKYGWKIINCSENGSPLSVDEIFNNIWNIVS